MSDYNSFVGENEDGSSVTYSTTNSKVTAVQQQVDQVRITVVDNMTKVIERGAKLGELEQKADDLNEHATIFKKKASMLSCHFWKQNVKMTLMIIAAIIAIILIIVLIACVGPGGKCSS